MFIECLFWIRDKLEKFIKNIKRKNQVVFGINRFIEDLGIYIWENIDN